MINKKRLQRYIDKQLKGLQHNLHDLSKEMDKDKLHDLRLHAKKVRVVSGFLKKTLHHKNKYSIHELKTLFHTAGNIRTAQLNLETLEAHKITNEALEKHEKEVIEKDTKKLKTKRNKFNTGISSIRRRIDKNLTSIKNKQAVIFYYHNIKILSNNFRIIDEANLHESRKIIKELLYNLKTLPAEVISKINVNQEYLDRLQELIGKWHDVDVTLQLLTKATTTEGEKLASLVQQKQDQLQQIVNETRDFDSRIMFTQPFS